MAFTDRLTRRVEGKPAVIVTRRLLPETERRMDELFHVSLNPTDAPLRKVRSCCLLIFP